MFPRGNQREQKMKQQYTLDKNKRLSFRVNETLYDWVGKKATQLGVSPCDYARSVLFQTMSAELTLTTIAAAEVATAPQCSDCKVVNNAHVKKHK